MAYSVDWIAKVFTIPQSDLTFLSGNNYSLSLVDVHKELRRLEWTFTDGLWAPPIAKWYETVTLSGVSKTPSLEVINDYTFNFTGSNYNVILSAYDNNLLDVYIPSNGISILGNNSVGKQTIISGSGVTEEDKTEIITGVLTSDISGLDDQDTLGGSVSHLKHLEYKVFINTLLVNPVKEDGSQHYPYSGETDAINYAEEHGILNLRLMSSIKFSRSVENFYMDSVNISVIETNNQYLNGSRFAYVTLAGAYTGVITAQDCRVLGASNIHGYFDNCALSGDLIIPDLGFAFISNNKAFVSGLVPPSISVGGPNGTAMVNAMGFKGGLSIQFCNKPTDLVKIELDGGMVIIDSSCTDGVIRLFGNGVVINNGSTLDLEDMIADPRKINAIYAADYHHRSETDTTMTIYEDDLVTPKQIFDIIKDDNGLVIDITPQ